MIICTAGFSSAREGKLNTVHFILPKTVCQYHPGRQSDCDGAEFPMRFIILACRGEVIFPGIHKKVEMRKWIRGKVVVY